MADALLVSLTSLATPPTSTDIVYVTINPGSSPADRKSTVRNLLDAIGVGASAAQKWLLRTRDSSLTFPVPYLIPETNNTAIALDIMPKGSPGDTAGVGLAWVDICDREVTGSDFVAARAAMSSTHASFGCAAGGTGTALPLSLFGPSIVFGTAAGGSNLATLAADGRLTLSGGKITCVLPTSDPAVAGQWYTASGVVKISTG